MWSTADEKTILTQALGGVRTHLLWKLHSLPDDDLRRPMTASLTNLLGILKHLTGVELRICDTFDWARDPWPPEEELELWFGGDMWARPDESASDIIGAYRTACASVDELVQARDLDTVGEWMGAKTTLRAMVVGQIWETAAHGGHADVVRELIDGSTGGPNGPAAGDFELRGARMRGEVGPEVWEKFRSPEVDTTMELYLRGRKLKDANPSPP